LGLSRKAIDREAIQSALQWAEKKPAVDFYELLGLPKESVGRCSAALCELLREIEARRKFSLDGKWGDSVKYGYIFHQFMAEGF